MISLKLFQPTKLKNILAGATALSVGLTAAVVYFPWLWVSTKNINNLTTQISEEMAYHTSSEVKVIFNEAQSSHVFLRKASDHNMMQLDQPESIEKIFFMLLEANPNLTWVMLGHSNGDFLGVQRTDEKTFQVHRRRWDGGTKQSMHTTFFYEVAGQDLRLVKQEIKPDQIPFYSPDRPWYKAAENKSGEIGWTTYVRRTNNRPTLDAAMPFYKNAGFVGVLNLGFDLDQISKALQKIQQNEKKILFITNSKSQLLASSDIQDTNPQQIPGQDEPQLNTLESAHGSLIRGIAQELKTRNISIPDLKKSQNIALRDPQSKETHYVTLLPLGHLDWVIGVITPESLYLGEIRKNGMILIVVILVCICLTLYLAINLADRLIVFPVLKLNKAARQIADQDFDAGLIEELIQRPDEIGELAQALDKMAEQVDGREQGLQKQVNKLQRESEKIQRQAHASNVLLDTSDHSYSLLQRSQAFRQALKYGESKTP
jgi:HAMP domain-containing protein